MGAAAAAPGMYTAGASLIGSGLSYLGAKGAQSAADRQQAAQNAAMAQEQELRRQMYEREMGYVTPIRDRLTAEAMSSQPLDYALVSAQIKKNYADAQRKFAGMANSGVGAAALRGTQLGQASDLGTAYAQGLQARRNLQMGLLSKDNSAALGSGYAGAYGQQAALAGQRAGQYGQLAAQGWQGFGQGLSGMAYGLGQMYGLKDDNVPAGQTTTSAYGPSYTPGSYLPGSIPITNYPTPGLPPSGGVPYGWGGVPGYGQTNYPGSLYGKPSSTNIG